MDNSAREKFMCHNTLVCIAQKVRGLYTTIDLRNDSYVSGKIDHIDGYMNATMSDAVFTDECGNEHYFDMFFVKERNIRYIHIPYEVNIKDALTKVIPQKKRMVSSGPVKMSLKKKKLLQRQQETLQRVEEIKKERIRKKMEQERKN